MAESASSEQHGGSRGTRVALAVGLAATVLFGALLAAGVPTVHRMWMWFQPLKDTPLQPGILLPVLAAPLLVGAWLAGPGAERPAAVKLALLLPLAATLQLGVAWSEGRGVAALRDQAITSGHAEFVRVASKGLPPLKVARDYEQIMAKSELPFCRSKPPGQLLSYMAIDALSHRLVPDDLQARQPLPRIANERHRQLVEALPFVTTGLAALALLPLFGLGRALLPRALEAWPALLFACCAPFVLIVVHLDQALYPLLAATAWLCAVRGAQAPRGALMWGLLGGVVSWIGVYVSFSLLPAALLTAALAWLGSTGAERSQRIARFVRVGLGGALGFGLSAALAWKLLAYDMPLRFDNAMANHVAWKGWPDPWALRARLYALDLVEFLWWMGPMLAVLWLVAAVRGATVRGATVRGATVRGAGAAGAAVTTATAVLLVVLLTVFTGKTVAEVARLWLFLLPLVHVGVVGLIGRTLPERPRRVALLAVLVAQLSWTVLLKAFQDF